MTARRPVPGSRSAEPAPVGEVLAGLLGAPSMVEGVAVGRLARAWSDVVGDRLAAETMPVRLQRGILVVGARSGAWAPQVRFLAGEIREGANRALRQEVVSEVRVVVDDRAGTGIRDAPGEGPNSL